MKNRRKIKPKSLLKERIKDQNHTHKD